MAVTVIVLCRPMTSTNVEPRSNAISLTLCVVEARATLAVGFLPCALYLLSIQEDAGGAGAELVEQYVTHVVDHLRRDLHDDDVLEGKLLLGFGVDVRSAELESKVDLRSSRPSATG